jgi:hypothetical protein
MSLSDLASLGTFVSGAAVLVSLIFLYFQLGQLSRQVRQAEKNQQAAVRQGRTATAVQIALALADPEVASAAIAVEAEPTDIQVRQFLGLMRALFANYEDTFYQHRAGLLDDLAFESWKRTALAGLRSAPRRVAWKWVRGAFGAEFEAFIDQLVAEAPLTSDRGAERWKADLADIRPSTA